MKRVQFIPVIVSLLGIFLCVNNVNSELFNRGKDCKGNSMIYDSDLNVTWYDYTNPADTWQNQMNWASGLTVEFGGTVFDDWRLPSTTDGPYIFGYDGTTTAGFNISDSDLGHLFYKEFGNQGAYDTSGSLTGCHSVLPSKCLTTTGPFADLRTTRSYWTGAVHKEWRDAAWDFMFSNGRQSAISMDYKKFAIAVRDGDVAATPEQ